MPTRTTGLVSTAIGKNGSSTRSTHQTNIAVSITAVTMSVMISYESHG